MLEKSKGPASYDKFIIKFSGLEIKSKTCFLPMVTDELDGYMSLYSHYRNGYLYKSGGVSDQPKLYLELMAIIDAVVHGE